MDTSSLFAQPPDFLKLLAHELRWKLLTALSRSDHRVQELVELLGQPMNLVSYHLKQLRGQQLVSERRSSADGRDVYYSLDFEVLRACYLAAGAALHPALAADHGSTLDTSDDSTLPPTRVLFLCTHNSARSQMAEGILRHMGASHVAAFSAGNEPSAVHPDAIDALAAMNIDIGQQRAKDLSEFSNQSFDYVITVCDRVREVCPVFPNDPERIHWSFADPALVKGAVARAQAFRQTAQRLAMRISYLLTMIDRQRRGKL
jgi:ArsR family transcriptional regulator, arsenate/arsenite/antimonite-responsive transcriptional repressor / arsenate reductase (thioredoxin)